MPNKKWYEMKALANNSAEIYIYDEIGCWGVTAKQFANDLKELGQIGEISLRINSPGGSVTDGIAIYNLLKKNNATVNVHIDGLAASMASVIAMAGDTVTMPENALMMVHNPWGYAMGDSEEMRKTADVLDKMKKALISAYTSKSGLSEEDVNALLNEETWMTGTEALEWGFVDQTTEETQIAASFDLSKLNQFQNQQVFKQLATVSTNLKEVKMTTKTESAPKAEKKAVTEPVATVDVDAAAKAAVDDFKTKETARKQGISELFQPFASAHADLKTACLDDMDCTVETARAKLLDAIGKVSAETGPQAGGFVTAYAGNGAIVKESMVAAIKARAGIKLDDGELSTDNPFQGFTLVEMARASLTEKGVGVASMGNRMQMVGMSFTHGNSDFSTVLADVANKAMLQGYESADETFQKWTSTGTLSDFKVSKRVGLNTFPSLRQVPAGAEFKYASMGDRGEDIVLATYGELFSINRQAIINDDLGAFTRIPAAMGRAAIRTVGDLVYAILLDNPNMSDGIALFDAQHNNLLSGAGSALAIGTKTTGLTKARADMKLQKDATGNVLNIMPAFLLTGVSDETLADTLMNDTVHPGKTNNERNPLRGMATVVADPRLDVSSGNQPWFLAAGQGFDTIEVAYLDGNSTPFIDQMDGWTVDGTSFKVRLDAGVSPLDFRTLYKANGGA